MTEKILLRPHEAAEAIGVSRARAYQLIAAGVIPHIKLGSSIRVPAEALRGWVAEQIEAQRGQVAEAVSE